MSSTYAVRSRHHQLQLDALLTEYEQSLPPDLRHIDVPVVDGDANVALLADAGGAASGCVFVNRLDNESAVIQRLYVRPAARGHGLARALMQHAANDARERGYRRLVLDTDKDQLHAAYQLYLSLGFKPCAPFGPVTYDNPTYMELPLS